MAEKRFKSKIDTGIALLLGAIVVLDLVFIVILATGSESPAGKTGAILTMIAVLLLMAWLFFSTYYAVGKKVLRVVSGPFRWNIPLADIQSVPPSRSLWSGPALSLDRLKIVYGNGRRILISPADKQAFLREIGRDDD